MIHSHARCSSKSIQIQSSSTDRLKRNTPEKRTGMGCLVRSKSKEGAWGVREVLEDEKEIEFRSNDVLR